jgi:hypothetical protein
MGDSWYNTGFDGISDEERRLDEAQGPHRLWIPGGASKELVWVDDEPVCIYEHNPKMNGNFRNWLTCQQGVYDEVVCCQKVGVKSRYYVGYVTGVDCSLWTDNRGGQHQYEMRLVPMKLRSLKKFRRKKEDRGAMAGTMWKLAREDDNAASIGDDWDYMRDVDMDKMFDFVLYRGTTLAELWSQAENDPEAMARVMRVFQIKPDKEGKLPRVIPPFNYMKILKPKTPKELRLLLGAVQDDDDDDRRGYSGSSKGGGAGAAGEDKVPF